MYLEDDLLPISALQHLLFCERQCALIHIEQVWVENIFTAQGRVMHECVHSEAAESRRDTRVEFGMPVRSLRLGLIGKTDVVEFHLMPDKSWRPFPVEYKRGKKKPDNRDNVQLCAQALCLEETLGASIPSGAIFYGKERRRTDVAFDAALREETERTARRLRDLIQSGQTPKAVYKPECDSCSLINYCLPKTMQNAKPVRQYFDEMIQRL
jgi:CRISPR-associated exonuclease Cas4